MTPTDSGHVQLYDSYQPGIKDGTYRIDLQHTVSAPGASIASVSQAFYVQGPRFQLDPADVHAQFPPVGATGQFGEALPSVVFNKRLLPWERDVPQLPSTVPWMALLVFTEGELAGDRGTGVYSQVMTVQQLLADPTGPIRKPDLQAVTTAEEQSSCRVITLASSLFASLVPTGTEATLLAQVRDVDAGQSATIATKDPGCYSVVVANRFPLQGDAVHGASNIAHLVSLEGFHDLVGGTQPAAPTQPQIQLVSLASWTFSCLAEPSQTFAGLATNLTTDPATAKARSAGSLLLRLPVQQPSPTATDLPSQAQRRLAEGHVALGYHTRTGDDGFAWYRGPLAPVVPATVTKPRPFATSDAAMAFDAQTGLFDNGLASAWQVGRSLALSDEAFATALMRLRVQANATLEAAAAGPEPHKRLAAVFGAGAIDAIAGASVEGGLERPRGEDLAEDDAPAPADRVRAALDAGAITLDPTDPDVVAVAQWLGLLQLLYPVPFAHLVADARMLPPETIRFFYVDPNWIGAMVDGAMSVGVGTSRELAVQQQLTTQLEALGAQYALAYRATQLGQPAPPPASGQTSGLLIRSALASGWPGLTVTGTASSADMPLLRLDHLAPTVLLCLFDGVPDTVTIAQPHEGLEFGVDDCGDITLRKLDGSTIVDAGRLAVYQAATALPTIRGGGLRVLNIDVGAANDLRGAIAERIGAARSAVGPAELALQMIQGPEQVTFSTTGGT